MIKTAIVVLGHGSRANESALSMAKIVERLARQLPNQVVRIAHRELCPPTLETVVADLVEQGLRRIVILPYFLHLGLHLRRDIPDQLEALRKVFPFVDFIVTEHLGYDDRLADILLDRLSAVASFS
jgi:sirohydrochlorin ferrochelatase